jgi:hypothetical protein
VLITDGPYTETKEHMGGFWILEAADLDEALAWGARPLSLSRAGRGAPVSLTENMDELTFTEWLSVVCRVERQTSKFPNKNKRS